MRVRVRVNNVFSLQFVFSMLKVFHSHSQCYHLLLCYSEEIHKSRVKYASHIALLWLLLVKLKKTNKKIHWLNYCLSDNNRADFQWKVFEDTNFIVFNVLPLFWNFCPTLQSWSKNIWHSLRSIIQPIYVWF